MCVVDHGEHFSERFVGMNRILTNFLHFIFRVKNKGGLTIPQMHKMKYMNPKEKKAYLKQLGVK